jgi:hypothetical protein
MARFKNLVFVSHPMNPEKAIMAKYMFDNGKVISIVAGEGLYSTSKEGVRSAVDNPLDVASFEVMFDGEVEGWQTREDINKIFEANEVL